MSRANSGAVVFVFLEPIRAGSNEILIHVAAATATSSQANNADNKQYVFH